MNAVHAPLFDHSLKPVWGADSERIWRNGACHEVDILLAPRPPARRHSAERALSTFPSLPFQFRPLHFIHYIVALISLFYLFFSPSPFPRLLFLFPPPILFLYIPPVFKVVIYIAHFRVQLSLFEFPRKKNRKRARAPFAVGSGRAAVGFAWKATLVLQCTFNPSVCCAAATAAAAADIVSPKPFKSGILMRFHIELI